MLNKLSIKLYQFSSGLVTLLGLLIFTIFIAFILPQQAERAESVSQGAGSPDMSYFYSRADLYDMAETYGAKGRAAYVRSRMEI